MSKPLFIAGYVTLVWLSLSPILLCRAFVRPSFVKSSVTGKLTHNMNIMAAAAVVNAGAEVDANGMMTGPSLDDTSSDARSVDRIDSIKGDFIVDPLLQYFNTKQSKSKFFDIDEAIQSLKTDGYYHISSVLTPAECTHAIDQIWEFIEDVSSGAVVRDDPLTWYPSKEDQTNDSNEQDFDPWPHTGYSSFPDMFQSLGAGFVLGHMRELLAERVFEPLFGTRELICSKEGFTFHRPLVVDKKRDGEIQQFIWNPYSNQIKPTTGVNAKANDGISQTKPLFKVCSVPQPLSEGQHYDQGVPISVMDELNGNKVDSRSANRHHNKFDRHQKIKDMTGLCHIQASVSFTNQAVDKERGGGHFLCYQNSHSNVHRDLVGGTYRATPTSSSAEKDRTWVPLTDKEIGKLSDFGCKEKRIYANVGDVILWRSDLVVSLHYSTISPP
jgi:hypothetical protein